uniref:Transcription elongation factor 1 homolog n=1 Tax=Salix viminalis TaxID=40686 RepID=A0A6N2MS01_SALVM
MARRKSRSNARAVKKPMQKLETIFSCPFCQHENSVGCSFDKALSIGEISCSICRAGFETRITPLTEPIDMYCEWIDECQRKFALVFYGRKFVYQVIKR